MLSLSHEISHCIYSVFIPINPNHKSTQSQRGPAASHIHACVSVHAFPWSPFHPLPKLVSYSTENVSQLCILWTCWDQGPTFIFLSPPHHQRLHTLEGRHRVWFIFVSQVPSPTCNKWPTNVGWIEQIEILHFEIVLFFMAHLRYNIIVRPCQVLTVLSPLSFLFSPHTFLITPVASLGPSCAVA